MTISMTSPATQSDGQNTDEGSVPEAAHGLKVVRQPNRRFLFNRSSLTVRKMRLTDRVISLEGGIEFPSPIYEIRDLPAYSYMQLPPWDKYLDGITNWILTDVEWEDGSRLNEPIYRGERKKWGGARFEENLVDRDANLIACTLGRRFEPPE